MGDGLLKGAVMINDIMVFLTDPQVFFWIVLVLIVAGVIGLAYIVISTIIDGTCF